MSIEGRGVLDAIFPIKKLMTLNGCRGIERHFSLGEWGHWLVGHAIVDNWTDTCIYPEVTRN